MSKFIRCLISIQMRAALSLRMMRYANDWLCIYWSGANVKDGVWFTENTATLPRSHSRSTIFLPTTFPENMKLWAQVRYPHDRQNVTENDNFNLQNLFYKGLASGGPTMNIWLHTQMSLYDFYHYLWYMFSMFPIFRMIYFFTFTLGVKLQNQFTVFSILELDGSTLILFVACVEGWHFQLCSVSHTL